MKIENILKSALIIGLLVGAADMNAALAKNTKDNIHCPDIQVTNNSRHPSYDIQILYYKCGFPDTRETVDVIPNSSSAVLSAHPEKEVRIDQTTGKTGTPNLWNTPELANDTNVTCTGSDQSSSCSAVSKGPSMKPTHPSMKPTKK